MTSLVLELIFLSLINRLQRSKIRLICKQIKLLWLTKNLIILSNSRWKSLEKPIKHSRVRYKRRLMSSKCMSVLILKVTIRSMEFILIVAVCYLRFLVNSFKLYLFMKMSRFLYFSILFWFCFFRILENLPNPKMKFLTKIKINEDVVSKGMGPNKRDSKIAAS